MMHRMIDWGSGRARVAITGWLAVSAVIAARLATASASEPASDSAQAIFERFAPGVVQIRLVEEGSGAKSSIGSGFAVSDGRRIVTNFHVVSEAIHHPDRYRAELSKWASGAPGSTHGEEPPAPRLRLLAFDVVSDLAVLEPSVPVSPALTLFEGEVRARPLAKGTRLYSLGNPLDLGLSIVEGTYNGRLEHARIPRIHFTGSLNPGMSGGPSILADGRVVGVNVATAGNQVSFLVPIEPVRALVDATLEAGFEPTSDFQGRLRAQLAAHQAAYLDELLARPPQVVELGDYTALTSPAPFFDCWGDVVSEEDDAYAASAHQCETNDQIFVSRRHVFSLMEMRHRHLKSRGLATAQFYELYTRFFESNYGYVSHQEGLTTPLRCETAFVETRPHQRFKTTLCARLYRNLEGLYDVVFKAAALGRDQEGFETALILRAVDFERAERIARRHLEAIRWNP